MQAGTSGVLHKRVAKAFRRILAVEVAVLKHSVDSGNCPYFVSGHSGQAGKTLSDDTMSTCDAVSVHSRDSVRDRRDVDECQTEVNRYGRTEVKRTQRGNGSGVAGEERSMWNSADTRSPSSMREPATR